MVNFFNCLRVYVKPHKRKRSLYIGDKLVLGSADGNKHLDDNVIIVRILDSLLTSADVLSWISPISDINSVKSKGN